MWFNDELPRNRCQKIAIGIIEDIVRDIDYIKENMIKFGIKPKECVWSRDDITEDI
jgi:hypothetical protein